MSWPDAPRAEYLPAPRMIRLHNRVMTLDEGRADFAALSLALRQSAEHEAAHHADPHIEAWHHLGAKPQPVARPSRWRGMWWRVRTAVQFLLGD